MHAFNCLKIIEKKTIIKKAKKINIRIQASLKMELAESLSDLKDFLNPVNKLDQGKPNINLKKIIS